jgi:hypothetical protein
MRCPDCAKFVSYGEPEVEVNDYPEEADDDQVTAEVTVSLVCNECGGVLKAAELSAEATVEHECDIGSVVKSLLSQNNGDASKVGTDDVDRVVADRVFDVEEVTADPLERVQDTDAQGKKITNARYQKQFYGALVYWSLRCTACREEVKVDAEVEEQASDFEEVA